MVGGFGKPEVPRRYLHAADGRDREIAKALSKLAAHGDVVRLPRHITMRGQGRLVPPKGEPSNRNHEKN